MFVLELGRRKVKVKCSGCAEEAELAARLWEGRSEQSGALWLSPKQEQWGSACPGPGSGAGEVTVV